MAVAGKLQPNEQVDYATNGENPSFVRRIYQFTGLGNTSGGAGGTTLLDTEIAVQARTATGDPLPETDFQIIGLYQTRISVRRYSRARGSATIVVDWGIRYSPGGAGPDVKRERSRIVDRFYAQPYTVLTNTEDGPVREIDSRQILRPTNRVRIERIRTDDGTTSGLVDAIMDNIGKMIVWRGKPRVVVGGGFSPFSQTQGYLSISLDLQPAVDALLADEIVKLSGVYGSLPVEALMVNQQYGVPDNSGTPAGPELETIPPFNWMVQ